MRISKLGMAGLALALPLGGCLQPKVRELPTAAALEETELAPSTQPTTGLVSGHVVFLHDRAPVDDFRASVRLLGSYVDLLGEPHDEFHFEGANGAFEIRGLLDGSYVVEVSAHGYVPARSAVFTIRGGQGVSDLRIALGHGAAISGQLVDGETGEPIVDARVRTLDNSHWQTGFTDLAALEPLPRATTAARTRTDANGNYTLDKLSNATYALQFDHPDYPREFTKNIDVKGEELSEVEPVRVPHGATVEGSVYGPDGEPAAGARILLVGNHVYPHRIHSDKAGHYVLRNIHPGTYRLSAARPAGAHPNDPFGPILDMQSSEVRLTVEPDEERSLDLSLAD